MALDDYTQHQQKIIKRYYENRDDIDAQKVQELVASLYLAEGKKRDKLWLQVEELLTRLKVPAYRIQNVMETKDVEVFAMLVQDMAGKGKL